MKGLRKPATPSVPFMTLRFQPMTAAAAARRLASKSDGAPDFGYAVTPNVDHMVRLHDDDAVRPLYDDAALVLNDSRILETLAGLDGLELTASPGADIVRVLFDVYIHPKDPLVLIGGDRETADALAAKFGLRALHWHQPPMGLANNPEAIAAAARFMADHPARFHFLCVGSPQQEMIAWTALKCGDVKGVGLCCGASVDFLTGKSKRAPVWMRDRRLEWLHRLAQHPLRMSKRYLINGPRILGLWLRHRGKTG